MLGAVQSGFGAESGAVLPACVLPSSIQSAASIVVVKHLVTTLLWVAGAGWGSSPAEAQKAVQSFPSEN